MAGIELRSSAFNDHYLLPARYSRSGGNVSPPLGWSGAPDGTAEFALVCEDPDAPTGTFVHWLLAGIPPTATDIPENSPPGEAAAGTNDFGEAGYGGPHPPAGDEPHRYFFRLYALRESLGLQRAFSADELHRVMEGTVLASGNLVGTYGR